MGMHALTPLTVSPTIPWTNLPATVRGPGCQLVVAMMCDADVCGLIPTTRLKKAFEWGVKQAPREAPDSEC